MGKKKTFICSDQNYLKSLFFAQLRTWTTNLDITSLPPHHQSSFRGRSIDTKGKHSNDKRFSVHREKYIPWEELRSPCSELQPLSIKRKIKNVTMTAFDKFIDILLKCSDENLDQNFQVSLSILSRLWEGKLENMSRTRILC